MRCFLCYNYFVKRRQDYEQQKHDALERVVHKKEIRTIKMEELRNEVEQLKEGQMMEIIFDGR